MKSLFLRATFVAVLCAMLVACGGNKPTDSQVPSDSNSDTTVVETQKTQLTTDIAVEGSLQLVEKDLLSEYDYYGAFTNGWAFVVKGTQAGYLSEEGEYKPLYSIPKGKLGAIDGMEDMEIEGLEQRDITYFLTKLYACNENGIVPYYKDGKWGYSDLDGKIVVEPIYSLISPLKKLGIAYHDHHAEIGDIKTDVFDSNGNVIATGECWADIKNGYYFIMKDGPDGSDWCNTEGTVIATGLWGGYSSYNGGGRAIVPDWNFKAYPGGIIIDGVIYDRTGKKIEVDSAYDVIYINEDGFLFYDDDNGVGVIDQNSNVVIEPSIFNLSNKDSDGNYYIITTSNKIRKYDSQFNELPSEPMLTSRLIDSHQDESTFDTIGSNIVYNQDGETIMELNSRYSSDIKRGIYQLNSHIKEGDWMYWFPDEQTRIVYRAELAK